MTQPSEHVAAIVAESNRERLVRYDVEARIRVYVTQGDIEDDRRTGILVNKSGKSPEEIQELLRSVALSIAQARIDALSDSTGTSVTAYLSPSDKVSDTVDWQALASPEPEDDYSVEQ